METWPWLGPRTAVTHDNGDEGSILNAGLGLRKRLPGLLTCACSCSQRTRQSLARRGLEGWGRGKGVMYFPRKFLFVGWETAVPS